MWKIKPFAFLLVIGICFASQLFAQNNDSSIVLLSPTDDMIIETILPQFSWVTTDVKPQDNNYSYELKIVRVWEDQTIVEAMENNPPWILETGIYSHSFQFQIEASGLVIASPYHKFRPTVKELEARLFRKESLMVEFGWQVCVNGNCNDKNYCSVFFSLPRPASRYRDDLYSLFYHLPSRPVRLINLCSCRYFLFCVSWYALLFVCFLTASPS